jgi:hypothetical protein
VHGRVPNLVSRPTNNLIGNDSENGLFHSDKASNGMPE